MSGNLPPISGGYSVAVTMVRKIIANLTVMLCSVVAALLCGETALRGYYWMDGQSFWSNPGDELPKEIKPLLPFRTFGTQFYPGDSALKEIHDRWDRVFSYKKPPGTYRIVCIGGSTTDNLNNRQKGQIDYPTRLQEMLRARFPGRAIEVINAGFSAYATPHFLILLLLDVRFWEPDLIILSENINDLTAGYWPNFTTDYSNKYYHSAYSMPDYVQQFTVPNVIFHKFRIYWFIKERLSRLSGETAEAIDGVKRRSYGNAPPPEVLSTFSSHLEAFVREAKTDGFEVLLASQPFNGSEAMFDRHVPNRSYNNIVEYPLQSELPLHHSAFNRKIAEVARKEGVYFLDNAGVLTAPDYFEDLVHYTPAGIDRIATSYSDFIAAHVRGFQRGAEK